jgi:hypothetical protein
MIATGPESLEAVLNAWSPGGWGLAALMVQEGPDDQAHYTIVMAKSGM